MRAPATATQADPRPKLAARIRETLMPTRAAPSGSSARARSALPTSVRRRKAKSAAAMSTAPPDATSRGTSTSASPSMKEAPEYETLTVRKSPCQSTRARFSKKRASPRVRRSWLCSAAERLGSMTTFWMITPRAKKSGAVSTTERYGSTPANTKSQYVAYMASIITAPWAKLMMRSTPKIRLSPQATSPYTPPSSRPLTTACSRSPHVTPGPRRGARLTLPLGHGEYRLGLGVLGGTDHHRLAVLHLDEGGRGVDVFARFVEADGVLGEDLVGEVRLGDGLPQLVPVHGARALEGVPEHEHDLVALHAVVRHGRAELFLVGVEDGARARALRVVPVVPVEEVLGQLAIFRDELRIRIGRVGEAHQRVDADLELGRRLRDELGVSIVAADDQEIRPRRLDLGELRGEIGRAQVVGNALHELVAHRPREGLDVVAHGRAEVALFVHHGHALDGHVGVLGHLEHVADRERRHALAVGLHAEGVLEPALGQVVGNGGQEEERRAVLLRHLTHGEGDEAREGADDGDRPLVDEARGLGIAELDLVLGVARHQRELRAAQRLDAARGVDLLRREREPVERQPRLEGERARHGQEVADLDLARLRPEDRRKARDGRRRARAGEKCPPADRPTRQTRFVLAHRCPPLLAGMSVTAPPGCEAPSARERSTRPRTCQRDRSALDSPRAWWCHGPPCGAP